MEEIDLEKPRKSNDEAEEETSRHEDRKKKQKSRDDEAGGEEDESGIDVGTRVHAVQRNSPTTRFAGTVLEKMTTSEDGPMAKFIPHMFSTHGGMYFSWYVGCNVWHVCYL